MGKTKGTRPMINKAKNHFIKKILSHGVVILSFSGLPLIKVKKNDYTQISKSVVAQDKKEIGKYLEIETKDDEFLNLKMNEQFEIIILPKSRISIIDNNLKITTGQVSVKNLDVTKKTKLNIESAFFSIVLTASQKNHFFLKIDLQSAFLDICNLNDPYTFKLMDDPNPQLLNKNESIQFQGQPTQKNEIGYDLLLENRRAPKGHWQAKAKCDSQLVDKIQQDVTVKNNKQKAENEKVRLQKITEKTKADAKYLCHKPYAQLDQCRYVLKQDECFRERCNAEGKWSESAAVSAIKNRCSLAGVISVCNY